MARYIEFMRLGILGLFVLLFGTGCLVEQRTLMRGWHVERTHRAEVMVHSNEAWPALLPTQLQCAELSDVAEFEQTLAQATETRRGYVQALPLQSVKPLAHITATSDLKRCRTRSADGIEIDRPTSVALITLGAAALM